MIGGLSFDGHSEIRRIDIDVFSTRIGRRRLLDAVVTGLVNGLFVGLLAGLLFWGLFSPAVGLKVGLAAGPTIGLFMATTRAFRAEVAAVSSQVILVRQCLAFSVLAPLLAVLSGLLLIFLMHSFVTVAWWLGIPSAVLITWMILGYGHVWLRYAVASRSASRHDLLPARPAIFLDWCVNVGLMRIAGTSVQFRHRQLQDSLTTRPTAKLDHPGLPRRT